MRKHNKGFTLIELVVTIAIIAVFSGVVAAVIGLGNNAYQSTSGNARVQMEAQEALDQIENLVIDANRSVYYANCSIGEGYGDLSLGAEITDDIEGADNGSKAFFICNTSDNGDGTARFLYDVLIWDAEGKKLIYTMKEYTGEADSGSGADAQSDFSFEEEPKEEEESGIEAFTSGEEDLRQSRGFLRWQRKALL